MKRDFLMQENVRPFYLYFNLQNMWQEQEQKQVKETRNRNQGVEEDSFSRNIYSLHFRAGP